MEKKRRLINDPFIKLRMLDGIIVDIKFGKCIINGDIFKYFAFLWLNHRGCASSEYNWQIMKYGFVR